MSEGHKNDGGTPGSEAEAAAAGSQHPEGMEVEVCEHAATPEGGGAVPPSGSTPPGSSAPTPRSGDAAGSAAPTPRSGDAERVPGAFSLTAPGTLTEDDQKALQFRQRCLDGREERITLREQELARHDKLVHGSINNKYMLSCIIRNVDVSDELDDDSVRGIPPLRELPGSVLTGRGPRLYQDFRSRMLALSTPNGMEGFDITSLYEIDTLKPKEKDAVGYTNFLK
jgi:hypothetical protein